MHWSTGRSRRQSNSAGLHRIVAVAPLRVLAGPATGLKGATGVAIDTKHNELWVTSWENHMAAVFPRKAEGNIPPLRVIHSAPKTAPLATMGRLGAVAFDPKRQEILAPN